MGDRLKFPLFLQATGLRPADKPGVFSPSRELAELCDQLLPELDFTARASQGTQVSDLVEALPPALSQQLNERFGPGLLAELISLEKERDPELFFSGLLNLAGRLAQREGTTLTALGLYHRIEVASGIRELTTLASQRREVLQGGGNFGAKSEVFLREMGREMGNWRSLAGTLVGATVASGLYKFTLYKTGRMMTRTLCAKGIGPATFDAAMMRLRAKTFGLVAGSLGGSLADRSLRAGLGQRVAWDAGSIGQDLLGTASNLIAWRLASNLSTAYGMRALHAPPQPKNYVWKELEVFAFRQGLGAASLGLSIWANQAMFDQRPESKIAVLTQVAAMSAGMNIGGLFGKKVLRLSH